MKVPSYLPRALCVIKYLFVIGITIWALYQPYMNTSMLGANIDEYMDKECSDNVCQPISDNGWKMQGAALEILYIIFIVLAILCLVLSFTKHTKLCNIVGILLLCMALAVMITVIIIAKTSYFTLIGTKNYFNLSTASILVIVACCLMIVKQLVYNSMLHSVGRAIMRK
jgi:hypothetical protein